MLSERIPRSVVDSLRLVSRIIETNQDSFGTRFRYSALFQILYDCQ